VFRVPPFRLRGLGRAGWFLPPALAGIFLRVWGLADQILLDDEWHSLNFVQDKSFLGVVGTHGIGANCIPQNLINWIWLHTVGWSEPLLFLPSVLCGVAGLLLFPVLVARLAGRTVALFFAWLLAISPCLVFYSRIVRPYSMAMFFGFSALAFLALWTRAGKARLLLAYALTGFAAIYFHLYAALPVLAPLGALWLLALFRPRRLADAPWISARALVGAGLLLAALLLVFLGPAHGETRGGCTPRESAASPPRAAGIPVLARRQRARRFQAGLWALAAWDCANGSGRISASARCSRRPGSRISGGWPSPRRTAACGHPTGTLRHRLFPLAMLQAATALDALLARRFPIRPPAFRAALGLLAIAGRLAGSPLFRTCALPNNFMHHSAFQDSYAAFDDSRSRLRQLTPFPQMPRERLHAFYFSAEAATAPGLVE
jgi:hypothetical protein